MNMDKESVIEKLARIYQQLYIEPGEGAREKYDRIVKFGEEITDGSLSHFKTDQRDSLSYEETPAGKVCVITLYDRDDFVTFLRIMADRCAMVDIPDTQGASIISGVANWSKIRENEARFREEEKKKGNLFPDCTAEFKRFTSDKSNYLDTLIVLWVGPYSGIKVTKINDYLEDAGSEKHPLSEEEWILLSDTIRRYHECTHFICRRKYPEKKNAIWDELVADAAGIIAAFGTFDPGMETLFLGIEGDRYTGGRLENYVADVTDEDKERVLNDLSRKISSVLFAFEDKLSDSPYSNPFEAAVILEECMDELWDTDY